MNQDIGTDYRSILQLALPISAGTFVQFLVVLTDNLFLSRTSDVALNGAGNAGIFYITLGMVGAGFANTGQILIARRMGESNPSETLRILRSGLLTAAIAGLVLIAILSGVLSAGFSSIFRDDATGAAFDDFLSIRKWGLLPSFMLLMCNAFFMGTARSKVLMWAMITTGSVNIIGDFVLMNTAPGWPALGARGAAYASLTAECAGLLILIGHVIRQHGRELHSALFLTLSEWGHWVRLALPMIFQLTLTMGTWSMFFFFVEQVGVLELKVSHIARNFFMLAFVVSQGIQQTTRTYISTLLGAGRQRELGTVMFRLWVVNFCGVTLLAHGGLLYPSWLAAPFFDDPVGLDAAAKTLPIIFIAMWLYSGSSVLLSTVQGSGHTRPALVIELIALVAYTAVTVQLTLIDPQPVWRIWLVELVYFGLMGLGASLFLSRWDWQSKAL
ncbi:MAG: MATE family efflux transporter [Crocinitomicaceae bacterium TMED114]|nr:MAG: MATE family efflux transporter [Crocinitomicaceae bacterium TMED114]